MSHPIIMLEGFNKAIVGFCSTWHGDIQVGRVVYDGERLVDLLLEVRRDLSEEEAFTFVEDTIINNYLGAGAPIVMWNASLSEIKRFLDHED